MTQEDREGAISGSPYTSDTPNNTSDTLASGRLATAWARYWARMVDLIVASSVIGFAIGFVSPTLFDAAIFNGPGGDQLLNVVFLPFALLLDAVLTIAFGNSLGKRMIGTKIGTISGGRVKARRWRGACLGPGQRHAVL